MASSWLTIAPNLCDGWKSADLCVRNPPGRNCGWIRLYVYELNWIKALRRTFFFFFKQSDTQVPLLLLVKAHHSLNVHTTLSGPSASVSGKTIYLSTYLSIYLVSCLFPHLLSWFCRTLSISSWKKKNNSILV